MSRIITNPNELSINRAMGRLHEVFMRLEGRCVGHEDLQLIIDQPLFADQVADLFRRKGVYLSVEDAVARAIMGPLGVFGPQEWGFFFRASFPEKELERAAIIGFQTAFLEQYKETHLLCWFPCFVESESLTIAYIGRNAVRFGFGDNMHFSICGRHIHDNRPSIRIHAFANAQACRPGWHLIRKEAHPLPEDLCSFTVYCDAHGHSLPLACEEFCKNIFYFHLAGGRFQNYHDPYLNPEREVCTQATVEETLTEFGLVAVVGRCNSFLWGVASDEPKIVCSGINAAKYGLGEDFRPAK